MAALAADAGRLAEHLAGLASQAEAALTASGHPVSVRRQPLALPGGVISTSAEAAEYLLRSNAAVFVDGYNVAKRGWPDRELEEQRRLLIARAEELVRRFGSDVTIVFDGASIVGAHTPQRRIARIIYSPAGTIADDVIRDLVAAVDASRAVVVVTDDREVVDDMRSAGANVVPANAFLAIRT